MRVLFLQALRSFASTLALLAPEYRRLGRGYKGVTKRWNSGNGLGMSGAEVFLAGPLLALANFLMKWTMKRFHAAKEAKEDKYETQRLVEAVKKLAAFANAKADTMVQLHLYLNLHPQSLSTLPPRIRMG